MINDLLKYNKTLSPLARCRGELYLEAIKYFAPGLIPDEGPTISQEKAPAVQPG